MSFPLKRLIFLVVLIAYGFELYFHKYDDKINLKGNVKERFEKIRETFRANLVENWERGGAAFVVYHKGEKVVDIWGGFADKESHRLWREDTMNVAFSCTKGVAALCIAHLVENGRLSYDDLMIKYWPEFGQNGKENITIRWILNHQAGLAFTDDLIDFETGTNPEAVAKLFEKQKPHWPAGTAIGYHALCYGWLVDQIIRRTDAKHRSVGRYFEEEFRQKHGFDFYIGLPANLSYRVSRLKEPSFRNILEELVHRPADFKITRFLNQMLLGGMLSKVANNVPWLKLSQLEGLSLNNPELYKVEQAAVLGIGTARAMAEMFEKLRAGELLTKKGFSELTSKYVRSEDLVTGANVSRGQGLMIKEFKHGENVHNLLGHSGYGGQNVRIDLKNDLTFAYMSNNLKVGFGDTARTYVRLLHTLYDIIEEIKDIN